MFSPLKKTASLVAIAVACCLNPGAGHADDLVRFTTNVGDFIVRVNPTDDPNLVPLADNFLAYINSGRYDDTVINRAADDFVIQMGIFHSLDQRADDTQPTDFVAIDTFPPVIVDGNGDGDVDFPTISNTRGTISLALNASGPNSGTSSFFINLADNSFLDAQGFVPFAAIDNLAVIDLINDLNRVPIDNTLTFRDVPVVTTGTSEMINILEAVVVPEPTGLVATLAGCLVAGGLRGRRESLALAA